MEDPKIEAQVREKHGSIDAKKLRKSGRIPGVLYGHKEDPVSFSIPEEEIRPAIFAGHHIVELAIDGKAQKAMIQDVQWHAYLEQILHVDLLRVDADEKVQVDVALHVKGTSPGLLAGGIMEQPHHLVPVECLAIRIPDEIVVRINDLNIGDAIHTSDVKWPEGVTCTLPENEMLIHIVEPKMGEVETATEEVAGAEPELIGADKKEESGE